ncbi:MAG: methyltransferase domain-containing protein [Terrimicrobiaceae bacterium]|nr:methyltransferase domain-containing protein [Terrimicrobiaceae bacterium]
MLRDLGFHNARGIDLNPGPDNPWVEPGDMMHLADPDDSLDLIYTNCVDHAFDLDAMIAEHVRALKPRGLLLYDIGAGIEGAAGPFEAIVWERSEDVVARLLTHFDELVRAEREPQWLWVLLRGKRSPGTS